jgi:hypothetical protein
MPVRLIGASDATGSHESRSYRRGIHLSCLRLFRCITGSQEESPKRARRYKEFL